MSETDRRYWIGFSKVSGIGAARLRTLIGHFGDPENAWRAPAHELRQVGLDRRSTANLLKVRPRHCGRYGVCFVDPVL